MDDGNYFTLLTPRNDNYPGLPGENRTYTQEFVNNEPVGPPELMFPDEPFEGFSYTDDDD